MGDIAVPEDRSELVAWLSDLDGFMRHVDELYDQRAAIEQQFTPLKPLKHPVWGWKRWTLLGIALTFFVAPFLTRWVFIILGLGPGAFYELATVAAGVAMTLALRKLRHAVIIPRLNEKIRAQNRHIADENQRRFAPQLDHVNAQLAEAGREFSEAGVEDVYPIDYLYPQALTAVITFIRTHRAQNVGEAINLYEQHLHQQRMEDSQQEMVQQQRQMQRMQMLGIAVNAMGHAATANAVREEGASTRASIGAAASNIQNRLDRGIRIRR